MTTINFPSSPTLNQEYSFQDKTWFWNGTGWQLKTAHRLSDEYMLDRGNHTGVQPINSIDGLEEALENVSVNVDASQTANFTAEVSGNYWLRDSFVVTLPSAPVLGDTVTFSKALSAVPTIKVSTGSAVIQTSKGSDTSVLYDLNAEITFTFNGTDWEV